MADYIPNTRLQQQEMLDAIGFKSVDELFADLPGDLVLKQLLNIPGPLSEMELERHMRLMAAGNTNTENHVCFLGAGAYDHYIPSAVGQIVGREEFYTAYTPYQPEISQGTLQAIFEYQTMICELTGLDCSNASLYDGATALAEAAIMACRSTGRSRVVISRAVHPEYRSVLNTYADFAGFRISEMGYDTISGRTGLNAAQTMAAQDVAAFIVQSPSFFGVIEQVGELAEIAHKNGSMLIMSCDPISLGILKTPGESGADIAVGEGQSLGSNLAFGGPYLGFIAVKKELMRKMPGRIVGQTADISGKRAFVLTLQAREQHIRREKATSNICSNQSLIALTAAVYLTILGKQGLQETAESCLQKSHYAYTELVKTGLFKPCFIGYGASDLQVPFFKEFSVKSAIPVDKLNKQLLQSGFIGGLGLQQYFPELENAWLIAVTEKRSRSEIDRFVAEAAKAAGSFVSAESAGRAL